MNKRGDSIFTDILKKMREDEKRKYEVRNHLTVELCEISSRCQRVESPEYLFGSTWMRGFSRCELYPSASHIMGNFSIYYFL